MSKQKITISIPTTQRVKETPEERAERVRQWQTTRTRVVPNKKKEAKKRQARGGKDYE